MDTKMGVPGLKMLLFYHVYTKKKKSKWRYYCPSYDKSLSKYKVIKTIGSSSDDDEVKSLLEKGKHFSPKRIQAHMYYLLCCI